MLERQIATSMSTLTALEEIYLDEKQRLSHIELAYQNNEKSIVDVFEQAIVFHNIEEALVRARAILLNDLMLLKSTQGEQSLTPQMQKARLL
jgi:outer membrane protein TolC